MTCYNGSCGYDVGGISYSSQPAISYNSGIEGILGGYSMNHSEIETKVSEGFDWGFRKNYESKSFGEYSKNNDVSKSYSFIPEQFLSPFRPETIFVDCSETVEEYVRETFRKLMDKELPDNIIIKICSSEDLRRIHEENDGRWNDGIQGFSINRNQIDGVNEVFVKQGRLDALMLTLGHEIGHVLSMPLCDKKKEEAKAFAFELAWMNTIHENNIGGLSKCIDTSVLLNPAKNGLHDVAFDLVRRLVVNGKKAIEVFFDIVGGRDVC